MSGPMIEYGERVISLDPPPPATLQPHLAALYLLPCVSKGQAKKALDRIFASFPRKPQRRRPDALTPHDHQLLRELFELAEKTAGRPLRPANLISMVDIVNSCFTKSWITGG